MLAVFLPYYFAGYLARGYLEVTQKSSHYNLSSQQFHHAICVPDNPYSADVGKSRIYTAITTCAKDEPPEDHFLEKLYRLSYGTAKYMFDGQKCLALTQQQVDVDQIPVEYRDLIQKKPSESNAQIIGNFLFFSNILPRESIPGTAYEATGDQLIKAFCGGAEETSFVRQDLINIARNDPVLAEHYAKVEKFVKEALENREGNAAFHDFCFTLVEVIVCQIVLMTKQYPKFEVVIDIISSLNCYRMVIQLLKIAAVWQRGKVNKL